MSTLGVLFRLLLLLLALWVGGLIAFGQHVHGPDPRIGPAEGIVVLTGSSGRIMAGLDLLQQRPQARMLITGVATATRREELTQAFGITSAQFACCVELDRVARDTVGNAEQTALWVQRNSINSIVVVTSASHLPRSIVELRRRLPAIELYSLPTRVGDDEPLRWGQGISALRRFVVEYNKYLASLTRARLMDDIGDVRR